MSSKAIEQFNAEGNAELQEAYSHLSKEIRGKTEKRILQFYREHPGESEDIVKMIKEEAQKQLIAASLEAYSDTSQENTSLQSATTSTLKGRKSQHQPSDIIFSDASLKTRIYSVLEGYLNLLQEIAPESFHNVCDFIDRCISDKKRIVAEWNEQIEIWGIKNKVGRWDVLYRQIRQNSVTNQFNKLSRLSPERGLKVDYEGKAFYTKGNLTVGILDYRKLFNNSTGSFNIATKRLMDMVTLEYTSNGNNPLIKIPLVTYMEKCGLHDKKKARKQVNDALDLLYATSISYDDSARKNRSKNYMDMRIIEKKGIENGVIYVCFTQTFAEMLSNDCSIMPYPLTLLKLSGGKSYPHAYSIGRKMAEHKYMNAGKANERIIAVKTLVDACDELPTEEEVRNSKNRSLAERIARPFLDSLEEACRKIGIGEDGYCLMYERGERIPNEELYELSYDTFINAYIHFDEWPDYPDQTKRIESKQKQKNFAGSKNK